MYAVTIGGQAGAGAPEIGWQISSSLGAKYIELLALRRLARELGATAKAVTKKELAFGSRKDRFLQKLEVVFSQFGWYGADFSMGMPPYPLTEEFSQRSSKELPGEITDRQYINGIYKVAARFIEEDEDLVLVKRAGCLTLSHPQIFHVGLFASMDFRVARVAQRLSIGVGEAEEIVIGLEHARSAWFAKIADADPMDKSLYNEVFYLGENLTDQSVAGIIQGEMSRLKPMAMDDAYSELQSLLNPRVG